MGRYPAVVRGSGAQGFGTTMGVWDDGIVEDRIGSEQIKDMDVPIVAFSIKGISSKGTRETDMASYHCSFSIK